MKIKICGLHPARDVQLCIDLGVNFLGFVFYQKSPRNVSLSEIGKLKTYDRLSSKFVAVTVNPSDEFIKSVVLNHLTSFNFMDQRMRELKKPNQQV